VQSVGFFPHAWYLAVLKERVFSRWAPPSEFYVGASGVAALVSFRIDRAGRISRVAVRESSGHARFDRSALAAIQGLAQLPALPEQYAEETLDVVIRFQNE
jgi:TonB family protein